MPASTPDTARGARWSVLALLFVCRASLGLQFQTLGSIADPLVAQFGFGYAEIGTLIGLFMLPGLLLSVPAGWAGRHASDRQLVSTGLVLMALGGGIAALAQGFGLLALGRLVTGAGFVFATLYFTKMVVDWFTGLELATALGILVMSWPFGIAAGQVGHAWLAVTFDWRAAFVVASVCCAAGAAAVALTYRSPPVVAAAPGPAVTGLPRDELLLTLLAAAVWGLFNSGYVVYLSFAPRVLVAGGYGATQAASVISIASWVMIFSVTAAGRIADRTGRHATVLCVCLAVGVMSLLLLPHGDWAVALSLAFGLIGAAPAGIIMSLTAQSMAPQRRAFGMGVFFSFYFIIMTAAPPVAGWLFDRTGKPFTAIAFAAGLFAATGLGFTAFGPLKRWLARRVSRSEMPHRA
ncbi:MAG: MFS transporter [Burkholderiaceae bacterium]|nr:MFS transporter [Burkholderiaceae bacterium]